MILFILYVYINVNKNTLFYMNQIIVALSPPNAFIILDSLLLLTVFTSQVIFLLIFEKPHAVFRL